MSAFMEEVDKRHDTALASGALLPIEAEQMEIVDRGLTFILRWVSTLSAKDAARKIIPGGPRDPNFNPFLKPEPALTVGPVGAQHVAILNKFPVSARHLVLARREFAEQQAPLDMSDFTALSIVMSEAGGLGFYNGGAAAGASQRHKHVQWLPATPGNAGLAYLADGLPMDLPPFRTVQHPVLPFRHVFVRVDCEEGVPTSRSAASMYKGYELACGELGFIPNEVGLLPACNMLVQDGWMLLVPRSREHAGEVSINALSFGGTLYVRTPDQLEPIRRSGPLALLREVA